MFLSPFKRRTDEENWKDCLFFTKSRKTSCEDEKTYFGNKGASSGTMINPFAPFPVLRARNKRKLNTEKSLLEISEILTLLVNAESKRSMENEFFCHHMKNMASLKRVDGLRWNIIFHGLGKTSNISLSSLFSPFFCC